MSTGKCGGNALARTFGALADDHYTSLSELRESGLHRLGQRNACPQSAIYPVVDPRLHLCRTIKFRGARRVRKLPHSH
jgi:hypothetical protein